MTSFSLMYRDFGRMRSCDYPISPLTDFKKTTLQSTPGSLRAPEAGCKGEEAALSFRSYGRDAIRSHKGSPARARKVQSPRTKVFRIFHPVKIWEMASPRMARLFRPWRRGSRVRFLLRAFMYSPVPAPARIRNPMTIPTVA